MSLLNGNTITIKRSRSDTSKLYQATESFQPQQASGLGGSILRTTGPVSTNGSMSSLRRNAWI